jgi:predicted MFS family arabinose efflux permease
VGAAGALVAPFAGRLADKRGSRWVVAAGITLLAVSYVLLWAEEWERMSTVLHLAALVVGVLVLDVGAQMTQVANQTRIFGLVPAARSRLNTVYMTVYFSGAALGSALGSMAWVHWRWNGVCALALGFIGLAAVRHALGRRNRDGEGPMRRRANAEDALLEA